MNMYEYTHRVFKAVAVFCVNDNAFSTLTAVHGQIIARCGHSLRAETRVRGNAIIKPTRRLKPLSAVRVKSIVLVSKTVSSGVHKKEIGPEFDQTKGKRIALQIDFRTHRSPESKQVPAHLCV